MTRDQILTRLRALEPISGDEAELYRDIIALLEHDGFALAATSQSEYESELEARLQKITDERDRFAGLLGEAMNGLGRATDSLSANGCHIAALDATNLMRRLRSALNLPETKTNG